MEKCKHGNLTNVIVVIRAVGALLMGSDGTFITGSDFLMDGGVTAAYWFGEFGPGER